MLKLVCLVTGRPATHSQHQGEYTMMSSDPATNESILSVTLHYKQYGLGALLVHLTVTSEQPVSVQQAQHYLAMKHTGNQYERDIALVPGEPLIISTQTAHMTLIYPGSTFVQVNEKENATLTTDGIEVIEVQP